jgi:hypothetical protein
MDVLLAGLDCPLRRRPEIYTATTRAYTFDLKKIVKFSPDSSVALRSFAAPQFCIADTQSQAARDGDGSG